MTGETVSLSVPFKTVCARPPPHSSLIVRAFFPAGSCSSHPPRSRCTGIRMPWSTFFPRKRTRPFHSCRRQRSQTSPTRRARQLLPLFLPAPGRSLPGSSPLPPLLSELSIALGPVRSTCALAGHRRGRYPETGVARGRRAPLDAPRAVPPDRHRPPARRPPLWPPWHGEDDARQGCGAPHHRGLHSGGRLRVRSEVPGGGAGMGGNGAPP